MTQRKTSEDFFHAAPENLNCAQSVLKGFQAEFGLPDSRIAEFAANGGGRAPGGVCGALHAADTLLAMRGKGSVSQEFAESVGALRCKEIKSVAKTPCLDCVKTADRLVRAAIARPDAAESAPCHASDGA